MRLHKINRCLTSLTDVRKQLSFFLSSNFSISFFPSFPFFFVFSFLRHLHPKKCRLSYANFQNFPRVYRLSFLLNPMWVRKRESTHANRRSCILMNSRENILHLAAQILSRIKLASASNKLYLRNLLRFWHKKKYVACQCTIFFRGSNRWQSIDAFGASAS